MRVAVLPWGDPTRWKFIEYCYGDLSVKGFSTLDLLLSSQELRPDLILIYVPDTLAIDLRPKDYVGLVNWVRDYVRRYLCANAQIHVEVLPGVMGGADFEFRADLRDTRLRALYTTYSHIFKVVRDGEELEILLDTTHGVNYFTILIYDAVFEASATLATAFGGVRVKVFNADPLPHKRVNASDRSEEDPCKPRVNGATPKLTYNLLYEVYVSPWDLIRYLKYRVDGTIKILEDLRGCEVYDVGSYIASAKALISSFRVGALVELIELISKSPYWDRDVLNLLELMNDCWLRKAKIEERDGRLKTVFTRLQDGFRLLIHAHAVAYGVRKALERVGCRGSYDLKVLRELSRGLLRGSEITAALIENELNTIKNLLAKEGVPKEWTLYADILKEERRVRCEEVEKLKSVDENLKRNFIAHAGFLYDFIEMRRVDDDVELRIRPNCWKVVSKILDKVFENLKT